MSSQGVSVLHQTGDAMLDEVRRRYRGLGVNAEVVSFIDDMARAYASASLVIARAGATTLAELCAIGKPSILIPYPHAAEDHQAKNALAMERAGASLAIRESELTAEGLATQVRELLLGRSRRRDMADAARKLGRPEAAAAIVDDLCSFLGVPADGGAPSDGGGDKASGAGESTPAADTSAEAKAADDTLLRARSVRRPKVRRAPLNIRPIAQAIDITG
jgi:UDP-N-acetylglucosamine--N-acetylmuramyl-(pentapeptide) pyrophosphoryl-undecaprenol N-acetylglucosamine transferase